MCVCVSRLFVSKIAINLLCQPPLFNDLATDTLDCLRCFCFHLTDTCYSSSIEPFTIYLNDQMKLKIAAIELTNNGYRDVTQTYPPNQNTIQLDPLTREHSIDSTIASSNTPNNVYFYWRLPQPFLGNQLMSFGSYLKYSIRYQKPLIPEPSELPDIIIRGNNITMYHYKKYSNFYLSTNSANNMNVNNNNNNHINGDNSDNDDINNDNDNDDGVGGGVMSVRFFVGEWQSNHPTLFDSFKENSVKTIEDVSRDNILTVLQNIEEIFIKASYNSIILDSSIVDIKLESGIVSNNFHKSRSAYIEQCVCPPGYTGTSCEECAPGYLRQPALTNSILGECIQVEITCQCNGHSDKCDQFTGQCLNCQNHTQGFNCEQCERGYYHEPTINAEETINCIKCPCGSNFDQNFM